VVKGKKKFHPKQKICSSKLGILYKKPSPLPFLQLCIPQFENDFSFLTTKKKFLFSVLFILNKKGKTKKILANYCISLDDLIFWVNPVFLITFLNDNF